VEHVFPNEISMHQKVQKTNQAQTKFENFDKKLPYQKSPFKHIQNDK
jgi:hypothetical protein